MADPKADRDLDEVERRIAQTRAELAQTVDAIADRVSPKRVAERTVADVKHRASTFVSNVGDALGVTPRPARLSGEPDDLWDDETPSVAPALIAIGAVLAVGAVIVLWRRRKR